MTRVLLAAATALALSACSTIPGGDGATSQVLSNLEHCRRSYTAVVGALGVPGGSLNIECPGKPYEAAPAPLDPSISAAIKAAVEAALADYTAPPSE